MLLRLAWAEAGGTYSPPTSCRPVCFPRLSVNLGDTTITEGLDAGEVMLDAFKLVNAALKKNARASCRTHGSGPAAVISWGESLWAAPARQKIEASQARVSKLAQ